MVADSLRRVRPHHLPMIVLGTVIDGFDGLSGGGKAQQIETAVAPEVGCVKDPRRAHPMVEQNEVAFFVAQPQQRAGLRPAGNLNGGGQE